MLIGSSDDPFHITDISLIKDPPPASEKLQRNVDGCDIGRLRHRREKISRRRVKDSVVPPLKRSLFKGPVSTFSDGKREREGKHLVLDFFFFCRIFPAARFDYSLATTICP